MPYLPTVVGGESPANGDLELCKHILYTLSDDRVVQAQGPARAFQNGFSAKVQKALAQRALRRLDAIDTAKTPEALNLPGFDFHGSQGKPKRYSVHINGPWCITFEWHGENAVRLDLENYH
jgi:proteic killer suppression protein